jgi:hypothetical protein
VLTDQELRRALFALNIIDERGDPDAIELILQEANASAPATDPWDNMPIGVRIRAGDLARRLAGLLGEPVHRCEAAALDALGKSRQRARFDALVSYAIELIGPCRELSGEAPYRDDPPARPTTRAPAAPSIRIVADQECRA